MVAGLLVGALAWPGAAAASDGVGHDVSYPQCGQELPADSAFGIVGVNGGVATTVNPCLADQLAWAAALPGSPGLQVYVNTANPGQLDPRPPTWPSSGESPYGACAGDPGPACSWVYGRTRAAVDIHAFLLPAAARAGVAVVPADLVWWLDVETMNTWQTGSAAARANNRVTLEGMVSYLAETGARVGLYSTDRQWGEIVGWVPSGSPLHELDSWLAGALDPVGAAELCGLPPLTGGGSVVLAQFVTELDDVPLDHDLPC
ncbi:hypothetical protein SAMN03159343_3283 [Klenkia marina]|uniref:Glycoside-hydrolase family GH114 TIM-barrel domain-containing protein n=1 Tax=Klenkia marina TaxID=1960309 RepID=A0A1G4YRE0_9ACTN|nr:hypothetical protein SAMN03159343_3283 [Klenkia marina]